MNKKAKISIIAVFAAVLVAVGVIAGVLNLKETQAGMKTFTVEVTSERDGYSEATECTSDEEYLGAFIRTFEGCEYAEADYGIYITGFHGMEEDMDNQYWWCVFVNGESATTGADEIVLEDGATYTFMLKQGW